MALQAPSRGCEFYSHNFCGRDVSWMNSWTVIPANIAMTSIISRIVWPQDLKSLEIIWETITVTKAAIHFDRNHAEAFHWNREESY